MQNKGNRTKSVFACLHLVNESALLCSRWQPCHFLLPLRPPLPLYSKKDFFDRPLLLPLFSSCLVHRRRRRRRRRRGSRGSRRRPLEDLEGMCVCLVASSKCAGFPFSLSPPLPHLRTYVQRVHTTHIFALFSPFKYSQFPIYHLVK